LRITGIEVTTLRYEYPDGAGFRFSGGYCNGRLSSLVQVHTDTNVTGIGSVYSHPGLVSEIIEEHLQPMLLGEDPRQVEALWDRCYRITRWYGRKGVAVSALGGIDVALWDIRGKIAGKPICELLGSTRKFVPAYASALLWQDNLDVLADEAGQHLSNGFRGMKMRLGRNYEYDHDAVKVVRKAIGDKNRLIIEGNGRYSLAQAQRMANEYRARGVYWFEEPFPPEDVDSYLALHPNLGLPLAAGENEFGLQGFRELVDRGTVDILQPDCSRCGGVTECRRVGLLAAKHGLGVATHSWSDVIAIVANAHVIASLPTGLTVEIDATGNALVNQLLAEPLEIVDGELAIPQKPGLGIELDPAALKRLTLPDNKFPDGNYSDLIFGRRFYAPAAPYESDSVETKEVAI
jgi:L-alanine-DL-glutamate epimerase-like enolase superfamily enzyme